MKNILGIIVTLVVGILIGFFGVFATVFTDGVFLERLTVVLIVLLIYAAVNCLIGLFTKNYLKFIILTIAPGMILLTMYLFSEFNIFYLIYMLFITGFSFLGAYIGKRIHCKNKKQ